jgi:predicted HicB family RNase H-like nuclease
MSSKSLEQTEKALLRDAETLLKRGVSAAEFSAHFFGPKGRLPSLGRTKEQRAALARTAAFKKLQKMLSTLRAKEASAFEKEIGQLSGRVTITVPRSLHAALKREAAYEHVSLSELMRLKLSVPYKDSLGWGQK